MQIHYLHMKFSKYKCRPIRIATADFLVETVKTRRVKNDVFPVLKETANLDFYTKQSYQE